MSSTPILPAVEAACLAAEAAFDTYRATSREARAAFLERIGDEIMAIGADLIETASRESGLPTARLEGERGRTVGQLKLFASVVRAGLWMGVRIDPALPERTPLPRPDLRLRMIPIGPVAVFGASNFPLAFSTAGGDTASALAAGCPVVVKGHPAHPATGELVAAAIRRAVAACGMPEGVFGHVTGAGNDIGVALVQDPRIMAVGFTGSRGGGIALTKLVQSRPVPIPIFAEMSSINPVLLMPAALAARGAALGTAFAQSVTMGVGQFCTNPGLLIAIESEGLEAFVQSASGALMQAAAGQMLTQGIHDAYDKGAEALAGSADVETLARGLEDERSDFGRAAFFSTTAEAFLANPALGHEVFGPSSILVCCKDEAELKAVIAGAEGQLTATLHMDDGDETLAEAVLPLLERKVGRILVNGWPTGVEVTHAMVHGGPFPATSDPRSTSVGTLAIDRFLRPVSYQNFGQALLPPELRDGAADVPKLIDGKPSLG